MFCHYRCRKLDDTEFRNPFDRAYVRITEDRDGGRGGEWNCGERSDVGVWCVGWVEGSVHRAATAVSGKDMKEMR